MNALIIGGSSGTGFGVNIIYALLQKGFNVYSISGSSTTIEHNNIMHYQINWKSITVESLEQFLLKLPNIDFILFNQNGSSLTDFDFSDTTKTLDLWKLEEDWKQTYFTSTILPFHIIKTLNKKCSNKTKIAWMLSRLIQDHSNIEELKYADYVGNKFQNMLIMKNFAKYHRACFFGIVPGSHINISEVDEKLLINNIINESTDRLNGTIRMLDLSMNADFNKFSNDIITKLPNLSNDIISDTTNEVIANSILPNLSNDIISDTTNEVSVKMEFECSNVNNSTMNITIDGQLFENLPSRFVYETKTIFPNIINITVSGKANNDTIVNEYNEIIEDKFIKLTKLFVHGIEIDTSYLETQLQLNTEDNEIVNSNYWGFNGTVGIVFNALDVFEWLVNTKKVLDS